MPFTLLAIRIASALILVVALATSPAAQSDCAAPGAQILSAPLIIESCDGTQEVIHSGEDQVTDTDSGVIVYVDGETHGFTGSATGGSTGTGSNWALVATNQLSATSYEDIITMVPSFALAGESIGLVQTTSYTPGAEHFDIVHELTNNTTSMISDVRLIHGVDFLVKADGGGDRGDADWMGSRTVGQWDDLPGPALFEGLSGIHMIGDASVSSMQHVVSACSSMWAEARTGALSSTVDPLESDQGTAILFQHAGALMPGETWTVRIVWSFGLPPALPPAALAIDTRCLPCGIAGHPYSARIDASGGAPAAAPAAPYVWSAPAGMPPGLSLDPTTGVISGTLLSAGQTSFDIEVTDFDAPPSTILRSFDFDGDCTASCPQYVCGDCDDDGFVSVADALMAVRYAAGLTDSLTGPQFERCNVYNTVRPDPTAEVSVLDGLWIAQSLVGLRMLSCCANQPLMRILDTGEQYCGQMAGGAGGDLADPVSTHFFQMPTIPTGSGIVVRLQGTGNLELHVGDTSTALGESDPMAYAFASLGAGANKTVRIDQKTSPQASSYWGGAVAVAVHATSSASYTLTIDHVCEPIDITSTGVYAGDTSGSVDRIAGSCGGGGSPDLAFIYEVLSPGFDVTFSLDDPGTTYDSVLTILTTCGPGMAEIACDDDSGTGSTSVVTLAAAPPGSYTIIVDGNAAGAFALTVVEIPAVAGCVGVVEAAIPGAGPWPYILIDDTSVADDTATLGCDPGGPDHVYSFTPAASGDYDFDLCSSLYDTLLEVRQDDCASGATIACNDDSCGMQSKLTSVPLLAGTTYYVIIDGHGGASGAYGLIVQPTPAVLCGVCPGTVDGVLTGMALPITVPGSTSGADDTFGPLSCSPGGADRVYEFQPPATGNYTISLCGSTFDTLLEVRGCSCDPLAAGASIVGCNDDACGSASRLAPVSLDASATYYIVVDGWNGSTGAYTLTITSP